MRGVIAASTAAGFRLRLRDHKACATAMTMPRSGAVVQWCSGTVVQWCSGAVGQWGSGAVVQWVQWCSGCSGAVVQWCSGAVVQWCSGAVAQWCSGCSGCESTALAVCMAGLRCSGCRPVGHAVELHDYEPQPQVKTCFRQRRVCRRGTNNFGLSTTLPHSLPSRPLTIRQNLRVRG
eukprot:SAG11_NODE_134_length_15338_cov_3.876435_11_plen_177_part_00